MAMRCIPIVPFLLTLAGLVAGCGNDVLPDAVSDGGTRDQVAPFPDPDLAESGPDLAQMGPGDCMDSRQNGDESDVDCGGSCARCPDGNKCSIDGDCLSGACVMGSCHVADCHDGRQNGN